MIYSEAIVEKIRATVKISYEISKTVKLSLKGRKMLGLCPFHQEKTPSFTVDDEKGFYHCFGCHTGGDIYKFVMEVYRMDFQEAIKYLAEQYSINIPKEADLTPVNSFNDIYKVLAEAANWFSKQLLSSTGYKALDYLKTRKISADLIGSFKLGFAPNQGDGLIKFLQEKKISLELVKAAGLIQEIDGRVRDKFRDRIIFPIFDAKDRVIAFGGRAFGDIKPKYLNSPETEVFKKNEVLYAINFAKKTAYKTNRLVLVEGYMDVLALQRAGITEAVATLGTAISEKHLQQMWQLVNEPTICFDGDEAGRKAMYRTADIAIKNLSYGKTVNFNILPSGLDPDDIINNQGAEALIKTINHSISLSEVIWQIEIEKITKKTPEQLATLKDNLDKILLKISNTTIRKMYAQFFNQKMWEYGSKLHFKKGLAAKQTINTSLSNFNLTPISRLQYIMTAEILMVPRLLSLPEIYENFLAIDFTVNILDNIRLEILNYFSTNQENLLDKDTVYDFLVKRGFEKEYEFLCGNKTPFIDNVSAPNEENAIQKWDVVYTKYILLLLEEDFKKALFNNESYEKIDCLINEIEKTRNLILQKEREILD
jgi:DNA primase